MPVETEVIDTEEDVKGTTTKSTIIDEYTDNVYWKVNPIADISDLCLEYD